ncbi:DUF4282 domain-containing protein [Agitococcus lubricus]|uniref:Uncharacterized protein DUF4282 n=1 Tax=Agitococcus lubricus TaxID=1077255 RepID=A0A2T5IZ82_9GAMM|nr:DUF4282 domain-containing protein [Agitococcus lubricus]PTQ89241.1 uncharacterized protein DUF4282 [Agitococcus lubricus]
MTNLLKMLEAIGLYLKTLLFDLNFSHYISLQIIPLCYLFILISTTGGLVFFVVDGFMTNPWLGLFYLCLSPLIFLIWISACRMVLELLMVIFRITVQLDEVSMMRESVDKLSGLSEVTALTRPLTRLFQTRPVREPRSSRQDTPPPTNHRRPPN